MSARRRFEMLGPILTLVVALSGPLAAQRPGVQEIGRSDLEIERSSRLPPQATAALAEAGDLYAEGDSEGAIPILQSVVDTLEPLAVAAGNARDLAANDPRLFETLRTAWLYLAAARWTLGDRDAADASLDRIVRLDPRFELDAETAGRQLTDRLERRKEELLGRVSFFVLPRDARILVGDAEFGNAAPPETPPREERGEPGDGGDADAAADPETGMDAEPGPEPFEPPEPSPMLVGDYLAFISRPGFLPATAAFTVIGGRDLEVEVELERDSAVVLLRTAPTGAAVLVDGIERGRTAGQAEPWFRPDGPASDHPPEDFSEELRVEDLAPGRYRITIEKDGFRSFVTRLQLPDLRDYELPPIVLEREEAVIGLAGLPESAAVLGNGRILRPDRSKSPPQVRLPPGAYDISVTHGALGYFETSVIAEDRRRLDIEIELRPALVYLGVLGDDPAGARALDAALESFRGASAYSVLGRATEGVAALAGLGVDAEVLRERAAARRELDWPAVQEHIQAGLPAALYFVAVLNDDLVADAVDLWWWPAAPGPARPDVRTVRIDDGRLDGKALVSLAGGLDPDLGLQAPRFGAVLIDSLSADAPIVATVEPRGPAQEAGLRPGMGVLAINGTAAYSTLQLTSVLEDLRPGDVVELEIQDRDTVRVLTVEPEWGWTQLDVRSPDLLPSAAAARLLQELERTGDIPRWLLEFDLANLLLAGGDARAAIRSLRTIDAPGRAGLGRETVQYTVGLALQMLGDEGQDAYRARARAVFDALATAERGRLGSDAGPKVGPRARLQAEALADN